MSVPACPEPLKLSVLIDYWLADLAPDVEQRVEQHFLGCASCSERLEHVAARMDRVRVLAHDSLVRAVVAGGFLESLGAEGFAVREYRLVPGGSVECTVTPNDRLVGSHLHADLRGAERVDLVKYDEQGREEARLDDIPFNASLQEVILLERTDRIRALLPCVKRVKLIGHEAGRQRVLGEYTFIYLLSEPR